jgi:hypothetical protein
MSWAALLSGLILVAVGVIGLTRRESAWTQRGGSLAAARAIAVVIVVMGLAFVARGIAG